VPPIVDDEKCVQCGICVQVCSEDVFGGEEEYPLSAKYPDECWHCGACVVDCPVEAVRLYIPLPMRL